MTEKWKRRLFLGSKVAVMGGAVMLAAHGAAHAANSGVAEFDTPSNTLGNVVMGPIAYNGGLAGFATLVADVISGHHFGKVAWTGAAVAGTGTAVHMYPTMAPHFGMANAALIHHVHHIATFAPLAAHVLHRLVA